MPDKFTGGQFTDHPLPACDSHLAAGKQPDSLDSFTRLNESLADFCIDPGTNTQNLKHLAGRQVSQSKLANLFFFRRQFDRTTLDEKSQRLEEIDGRKYGTP